MKSLFPKGAKSTFVTSEKNAFLCASLYTRLWKTKNLNVQCLLYCSLYSDQKCVLKVGGKLNNLVILITPFWSKVDLAPFGNKLFIYRIVYEVNIYQIKTCPNAVAEFPREIPSGNQIATSADIRCFSIITTCHFAGRGMVTITFRLHVNLSKHFMYCILYKNSLAPGGIVSGACTQRAELRYALKINIYSDARAWWEGWVMIAGCRLSPALVRQNHRVSAVTFAEPSPCWDRSDRGWAPGIIWVV